MIAKRRGAPLYKRIREILESARAGASRSVNTTHVVANRLIGREIVGETQKGRRRAEYGQQLIEQLSERLKADYGAGYSVQSLFYMKQFYLGYPALLPMTEILHTVRGESGRAIDPEGSARGHTPRDLSALPKAEQRSLLAGSEASSEAPRRKSPAAIRLDPVETTNSSIGYAVSSQSKVPIRYAPRTELWRPGLLSPNLSWTQYRALLKVADTSARAFYEIEALKNNWSGRELERQINSLLYERLAKSRDKAELMRLATRGQEIAKPADIFKDAIGGAKVGGDGNDAKH